MGFFERLWGESKAKPAALSREEVVRFYQQFGFFPNMPAGEVVSAYESQFGDSAHPFKRWDDVFLLSLSPSRAWHGDPEADVCDGNRVYAQVLGEWAGISEGAFAPSDITEHWAGPEGPVSLSFLLGTEHHTVSPNYLNDYVDLDVLRLINSIIVSSGRQFAYASDVNFAVVLCLTLTERQRFSAERAFPFTW